MKTYRATGFCKEAGFLAVQMKRTKKSSSKRRFLVNQMSLPDLNPLYKYVLKMGERKEATDVCTILGVGALLHEKKRSKRLREFKSFTEEKTRICKSRMHHLADFPVARALFAHKFLEIQQNMEVLEKTPPLVFCFPHSIPKTLLRAGDFNRSIAWGPSRYSRWHPALFDFSQELLLPASRVEEGVGVVHFAVFADCVAGRLSEETGAQIFDASDISQKTREFMMNEKVAKFSQNVWVRPEVIQIHEQMRSAVFQKGARLKIFDCSTRPNLKSLLQRVVTAFLGKSPKKKALLWCASPVRYWDVNPKEDAQLTICDQMPANLKEVGLVVITGAHKAAEKDVVYLFAEAHKKCKFVFFGSTHESGPSHLRGGGEWFSNLCARQSVKDLDSSKGLLYKEHLKQSFATVKRLLKKSPKEDQIVICSDFLTLQNVAKSFSHIFTSPKFNEKIFIQDRETVVRVRETTFLETGECAKKAYVSKFLSYVLSGKSLHHPASLIKNLEVYGERLVRSTLFLPRFGPLAPSENIFCVIGSSTISQEEIVNFSRFAKEQFVCIYINNFTFENLPKYRSHAPSLSF